MTNFLFKHKNPELMQGKDAPASVRDKVGYLMLNRLGWMAEQRVGRNSEVKPSEGKQWELGVKGIAFNDSLQYSLVYYDIVKTNIPNSLEDINGNDIVKLIGEQTSKGIELDTNWQVTDELTVLLNYAYTDAEISKNTEDPEYVGNTPEGIPEHSGALFVTYDLNPVIPNLSLSAGANYVDDVPNKKQQRVFCS